MSRVSAGLALGFASILVLVAIAGFGSSARLLGASEQATPSLQSGQPSQAEMAEMMKQHQQMMADMKAGDAKLDELVTTMNASTGETKVSAMAQVVNELVRQQKAMHAHMMTADQQMMMRMMGKGVKP